MDTQVSDLLDTFKTLSLINKKKLYDAMIAQHKKRLVVEHRKEAARIAQEKKALKKKKSEEPSEAKKSKYYFTSDTQDAIVEYQNLRQDQYTEKETLYVDRIRPAFEKLAENLIIINKFTCLHDDLHTLKNDCVNFLFDTIKKFDASKGTNAFSYFNVVAKNLLILRSRHRHQHSKRIVSIHGEMSQTDKGTVEDYNHVPSPETLLEHKDSKSEIIDLFERTLYSATDTDDIICLESLILIFSNLERIDIQTKPAMFLYTRTITGMNNKRLIASMIRIKELIRDTLDEYEEEYDYGFVKTLGVL